MTDVLIKGFEGIHKAAAFRRWFNDYGQRLLYAWWHDQNDYLYLGESPKVDDKFLAIIDWDKDTVTFCVK